MIELSRRIITSNAVFALGLAVLAWGILLDVTKVIQ